MLAVHFAGSSLLGLPARLLRSLKNLRQCLFEVFSCFRAFFVFCFTFHPAIMPLPHPLRKALEVMEAAAKKISSSIDANTAEQHATKNVSISSPVEVALVPTPEAQADQLEARNARQHAEQRDTQRLHVERVALLVGSVVALANIGLWIETQHAVNVAVISANASQRSAAASEAQAKATQDSIQSTIENFRRDQRAWVGPTNFNLVKLTAPDPIEATVDIVNTGKSVATDVRVTSTLHPSDTVLDIAEYVKHPVKTEREISHPRGLARSVFVIFPNETLTMPGFTGSTDALGIESIKNGRKYLYFFGEITYQDAFKIPHKTRFCGIYMPEASKFSPCSSYSYAD